MTLNCESCWTAKRWSASGGPLHRRSIGQYSRADASASRRRPAQASLQGQGLRQEQRDHMGLGEVRRISREARLVNVTNHAGMRSAPPAQGPLPTNCADSTHQTESYPACPFGGSTPGRPGLHRADDLQSLEPDRRLANLHDRPSTRRLSNRRAGRSGRQLHYHRPAPANSRRWPGGSDDHTRSGSCRSHRSDRPRDVRAGAVGANGDPGNPTGRTSAGRTSAGGHSRRCRARNWPRRCARPWPTTSAAATGPRSIAIANRIGRIRRLTWCSWAIRSPTRGSVSRRILPGQELRRVAASADRRRRRCWCALDRM